MPADPDQVHHWETVAETWAASGYDNPLLASHKRGVYARLLESWTSSLPRRALKTDLFAEAFNSEEFVSLLPWRDAIIGIDISPAIVSRARLRSGSGPEGKRGWVACDVRALPFGNGCFDLVLSDSTLDHLRSVKEIEGAIAELSRVLRVGGTLVLTMDNPHNLTYPPQWVTRLWMRLGLAPYFIGATLNRRQMRAALDRAGMKLVDETAILHYPHPDALVRVTESALCRLSRGALDGAFRGFYSRLERLEESRLRYLTGRYLAVRATKVGT
jgi:SAM-dependent methyltransferase